MYQFIPGLPGVYLLDFGQQALIDMKYLRGTAQHTQTSTKQNGRHPEEKAGNRRGEGRRQGYEPREPLFVSTSRPEKRLSNCHGLSAR